MFVDVSVSSIINFTTRKFYNLFYNFGLGALIISLCLLINNDFIISLNKEVIDSHFIFFVKFVFILLSIFCYITSYKSIVTIKLHYLTFVIIGLYIMCSSYLGSLSWNCDSNEKQDLKSIDSGWFCSELCLALGMIGTVIGFIQMLSGFTSIPEGTAGLQKMLAEMSFGMSTALYTTLAGLIFGNLLKLQCFWLEKAMDSKEGKCHATDNMDPKQVS